MLKISCLAVIYYYLNLYKNCDKITVRRNTPLTQNESKIMYAKFLEKFEDIFGDINNFTPENMEGLVEESLKMFKDLQQKLESPDPKVQEKALQTTVELKKKLEQQAQEIYDTTQMDNKDLNEFLENPKNFDKKEWQSLEKAQKNLKEYSKNLKESGKPKKKTKKRRSSKNGWIAS